MSFRIMRILVLFDLPTLTSEDLREYRRFRKHLIKEGFIMVQESVYTKIALNHNAENKILINLEKNKPKKGNVIFLSITEKQYTNMKYIVGTSNKTCVDTTDRMVIL